MATENGRSDDKHWLYGGDSQDYNRMKEMFEGVFLRQGGRSLCGHFTGLYSNEIIAQKIVELAPYERELDEDDPEEREVQWNALADVPQGWKFYVDLYLRGNMNINDQSKVRALKVMHYQRHHVKGVCAAREDDVYSVCVERSAGKAKQALRQIPHEGSRVLKKWTQEFFKPDQAVIREHKAFFRAGDVWHTRKYPLIDDSVNVEAWFTKFEANRNHLARLADDKEALQGCDSQNSLLSWTAMKETTKTVFSMCTEVYTSTLEADREEDAYSYLRDKLREKYRNVLRKKKVMRDKDSTQKAIKVATKKKKEKAWQITQVADDTCRACGKEGHWANNPLCEMFVTRDGQLPKGGGKGKGKGGGKGKGKGGGKGGGKGKGANSWPASSQTCWNHAKGSCHYGESEKSTT